MAGNGVHTVHKDGAWVNEADGSVIGEKFELKADAVAAGRAAAVERRAEHHIHDLDGTIGERNSYGNDPRDIPG